MVFDLAALVLDLDRALVAAQAAAAQKGLEAASVNVRATGVYLDASMPGDFAGAAAAIRSRTQA